MTTKKWVAMPLLITARYYHRSVSLGDSVYVVGGKGVGDKVVGTVEYLDLRQRQRASFRRRCLTPQVICNGVLSLTR